MRRLLKNTFGRTAKRLLPAAAIGMGLAMASMPNVAHAQFFDGWGSGGGGWGGWGDTMGPSQIYNSITDRGFRVIGPMRRNGSVFVADVVDRRGRRERLIVAAADGEILQRFLLQDPGFGTSPRNDLAQPRQEFGQPVERADRGDLVPPASIPNVGDGETAVEPQRQRALPRPIKPQRPRVVDRTPDETQHRDVVPSHAGPRVKLRVPADATAKHPSEPATSTASRPADTPEKPSVPAPTPAAPTTTTTKLSDPLAIPGGEPKAAKPPAEAPKASAAAGTPSNPRVIPGTVTGAPAPATPPPAPAPAAPAKSSDVPVAPLD